MEYILRLREEILKTFKIIFKCVRMYISWISFRMTVWVPQGITWCLWVIEHIGQREKRHIISCRVSKYAPGYWSCTVAKKVFKKALNYFRVRLDFSVTISHLYYSISSHELVWQTRSSITLHKKWRNP